MTLQLLAADPAEHHEALSLLNTEYMGWATDRLTREWGPLAELKPETADDLVIALCALQPPQGVFYLARAEGQAAGMGGLRRCSDGWVEIKRLYVRPAHRGQGWGRKLLERLIEDARAWNCPGLRLDSALFMQAAHRLYEAHGFVDCAPYAGTEVPAAWHARWRFMQCTLPPSSHR